VGNKIRLAAVDALTVVLLVFIPAFFVGLRLLVSRNKGALGESRIGRLLRRLPDEEFAVINDLLIWTSAGTRQIDHLVISSSGIFVIETKNFSGWIHGNEGSEYWTQTIYNEKTKFRNPIKQNWAHVYALKEILSDLESIAFHPIIVFVGTAELKNVYSRTPVIYDHELLRTILDANGEGNLTVDQVRRIARRLNEARLQERHAKREHVRFVQEYTLRRRQVERAGICPKCGGGLVVRSGRYGKFYGCSSYPGCTYTRPYRI
jgi:hypothetical protein